EVQKFMTRANYAVAEFLVQANMKWWNGLTADQQDAIMKAAADAEAFIREKVAAAEAEAEESIARAGIDIHILSDEELDAFIQATAPVRETYLKNSGELGAKLLPLVDNARR
ncbi:MAG: hypothetical protein J1E80_07485, partial [Desulfovibrionaceae bacterium]|nr:hypothetical protein [Desulfovibrionaceae bacterium]